jgi:hypothetical protein
MRHSPLSGAYRLKRWPVARAVAGMLCFVVSPSLASRHQAVSAQKHFPVILWVREVNHRPLYWVNDKPVGRDSLGGLERAIGPEEPGNVALTVILDSRVPIDEIHEIDGMLDKIPIEHVRYFMYWVNDPRGMQEVVLEAAFLPLPKPPPRSVSSH